MASKSTAFLLIKKIKENVFKYIVFANLPLHQTKILSMCQFVNVVISGSIDKY